MERMLGANLHDHLLAAEERVADELASSQRDRLLTIRHVCGIGRSIRCSVFDVDRVGGCWASNAIWSLSS